MKKKQILVVEDERELARLIELHLSDAGYEVTLAHDGLVALDLLHSKSFDCLTLDLMLPGMDGIELCQQVRRQTGYTPILMLTAKSSELDRVLGLEVGADDYLTKPFSIRELVARVKAILRRVEALAQPAEESQTISVGALQVDPVRRRAALAGRTAPLRIPAGPWTRYRCRS